MELTCEYIAPKGDNTERIWTCVGKEFGLHIWIAKSVAGGREYYGGLEMHYRAAPDYMKEHPPSNTNCWLLNAPCWHDGTSLYAHEVIIPFWLRDPENNERMFEFLRAEYRRRDQPQGDAKP